MNLIPKFLRPYPTLRLFGRPIRQPDVKAVDPEQTVILIRRPLQSLVEPAYVPSAIPHPEPAHPDVVVLRTVEPPLEPDAQDQWSAFGIVRRGDEKRQSHSRASELRHSGPTLLPYDTQRVDPDVASDASAYRPVCAHEGLNEWGPPPSLEQTTADIRAISIPALTVDEIMSSTHIHPMLRQIAAVRNGTAKRDSKGRFLKRTTDAP